MPPRWCGSFAGSLDALGRKNHRHYLLTVATPAGTWQQGGAYSVSDSYDLAALARSVDWLNVMTYDMNTIFSPLSAFNAPLDADPRDRTPEPQRSRDNLTSAVRYYESQDVPAAKIMLGVAFYGRGFTGVAPQDAGLYSKYAGGLCGDALEDDPRAVPHRPGLGAPLERDRPGALGLQRPAAHLLHLRRSPFHRHQSRFRAPGATARSDDLGAGRGRCRATVCSAR